MSSIRQYVFSVTIFRPSRHLQDVEDVLKRILNICCKEALETSWTHLGRRLEDVFKMPWKTKTCYAEDVFKTSWRQTKCLLGISVSNKSKSVSDKSISHKSISDESKANPKCKMILIVLLWNSSSITLTSLTTVRSCEISSINSKN